MKLKSIMWKYINEEHELLKKQLKEQKTVLLDKEIDLIYIVAHGSSYNAGVTLAGYISSMLNADVYVNTPDNFIANVRNLKKHSGKMAVIGISQTGTSHGVLKAMERARDSFYLVVITNVPDSPMDRIANETIYLNCGDEDSNAKTKGYSSTLLSLMLFAIENGYYRNQISTVKHDSLLDELEKEIDCIPAVTDTVYNWCEKTAYGKGIGNLYVLGSGINYGTSLEGQLKVMETMCIPTMFNDILEFSHGMHRSINKDSYVMLINAGSVYSRELFGKTYDYLQNITKHVMMINVTDYPMDRENVIDIPLFVNDDSVLLVVLAVQILSVYIPELNGYDPNRDANNDYTDCVETRV